MGQDRFKLGYQLGYRPGLNTLRAVAISVVVALHLGVQGFSRGHRGVDLFFVISGFLISTLLLEERDRYGRVRLRAFYTRRAARLLPPLALVIPAAAAIGTHRGYDMLGPTVATVAYMGNIPFMASGGDLGPMTHMWSLAVEEQFYAVWPAVLVFFGAFARGCIGTLTAWSAAMSFAGWWHIGGIESYARTDLRMWQFLLGALVGIGLRADVKTVRFLSSRPLVYVAAVVFSVSVGGLFGGRWSVVSATVASLTLVAGAAVGTVPSGPAWVQWVGVRCYGIYLWHVPIKHLVAGNVLWTVSLTVSVAAASWALIERPAIRWGRSRTEVVGFHPGETVPGGHTQVST